LVLRHPPGRRIGPREWFTSDWRWHAVAERGEEPADPDAHHLAAVIRRALRRLEGLGRLAVFMLSAPSGTKRGALTISFAADRAGRGIRVHRSFLLPLKTI